MIKTTSNLLSKLIIRPATLADSPAIAYVHTKAWQESYVDMIDQSYLNALTIDERLTLRRHILSNASPDHIHLVAVLEDEIIGFCDAGPSFEPSEHYKGEVYAIYLLQPFKKVGIGALLMKEAIQHLMQKKLMPYAILVLEANHPARGFYEKMGMRLLQKTCSTIGRKTYTEIIYVSDLTG